MKARAQDDDNNHAKQGGQYGADVETSVGSCESIPQTDITAGIVAQVCISHGYFIFIYQMT